MFTFVVSRLTSLPLGTGGGRRSLILAPTRDISIVFFHSLKCLIVFPLSKMINGVPHSHPSNRDFDLGVLPFSFCLAGTTSVQASLQEFCRFCFSQLFSVNALQPTQNFTTQFSFH